MLKQLIVVSLVLWTASFFAADKTGLKKNKAGRLKEQLSHIAKEWCNPEQQANAAAYSASWFAKQAKIACDKAAAAAYLIEIAMLKMTQIRKPDDVVMFAGQWVVFKGTSSYVRQEDWYPLHDKVLKLKAGYVSKASRNWGYESAPGHELYRVFSPGYSICDPYALHIKHIRGHKPNLFMRNMTLQEENNIQQALKNGMAQCEVAWGREETCVLS